MILRILGTFIVFLFLAGYPLMVKAQQGRIISHGAIVRGDTSVKKIALVFTADEFVDGGSFIASTLEKKNIRASFFFTGNFYREPANSSIIRRLLKTGNYLGSHSDKHLLYCDWTKRDSLLVTKNEFLDDLEHSYHELCKFGISREGARYFLPPYEWYNDSIAAWTKQSGLTLVNFTGGTRSNADYTYPEMGNRYVNSKTIYKSILDYEQNHSSGLNGFILLIHFGTDNRRQDKFYNHLPSLISELQSRGYEFVTINGLLEESKRSALE